MTTTTNSSFYKNTGRTPLKLRMVRLYFKVMSTLRPSHTAKQLVRLFAHPRVNRSDLVERYGIAEFLSNGTQDWLEFENDKIFLYYEGTPQVLLISGWESSIFRFETIMENLRAHDIGFLYFDLPGQGISTGKMNNAIKTSRLIRHLLLKYQSINSIIGHSFGGATSLVAMYLASDEEKIELSSQLRTIVTVGSPTRYSSVVDPFFEYLKLPDKIKEPFMDEINRFVDVDFREYDVRTIDIPENIDIHMFHDHNDTIVSVEDSFRVSDVINSHLTRGLGHRRIMHTPEVIDEILLILSPQLEVTH